MEMPAQDIAALAVFTVCWLGYEPLQRLHGKGRSVINADMTVIRGAWMQNMAVRDNRFMDGQLLGQALSSASFFASSTLILIAAASGALFGGDASFRSASSLVMIKTSNRLLFEGQLALVLIALARGLLDFMWAIRQMNYCLAVFGAAPITPQPEVQKRYGELASRLINPSLSAYNQGVRCYYFALAAAAWLFGAWACIAASLGAVFLLVWRQRSSPAAKAISELRELIES